MRTERLIRTTTAPASIAFGGLLAFIFIVYANPGNWFDGLEDIGFAKIAAGFSLVALLGSWLLYDRRLTIGGIQGWTLLALFTLVGLSATWSYWPKYTFDTFTDGLKYLAVFFLVANLVDTEARLATFVRVLALASCIPAFGAIWSHAHGEHLVEGDRASWIGFFANPNDLAYHLVVGVAMLLAAANAAKTTRRRIAWWSLLAPVFYGILLTQSRGGMLAASVVCVFWALRSVKRAPLIVGAACVMAAVVFISPNNPWSHRTQSATAFGEDVSARGRIDAWRTGVNIAKERPLTGVGAGAFMIAWPEFAPGDAGEVRTQHNTFIQLLSELGIPALLLFVGALAAGVFGMRRSSKTPSSLLPFTRGVQCGLAGFVCCSIFGGIAWTWPLYLLLGLAFAVRRIALVGAPAGVHRLTEDTVVEPMPPPPLAALVGR
ncbi:MAG: O-antigen ligase family protein [Polyangia bacterium]